MWHDRYRSHTEGSTLEPTTMAWTSSSAPGVIAFQWSPTKRALSAGIRQRAWTFPGPMQMMPFWNRLSSWKNEGFGRLLNRGVKALSEDWGEKDKILCPPGERDGDHRCRPPRLANVGLMYAVSSRGADHCRALCFAEMGGMPEDVLIESPGPQRPPTQTE